MRTDTLDTVWVVALASKWRAFTEENTAWSLLIIVVTWLVMIIVYWVQPGGPAWGKYRLKRFFMTKPIPGPRGFPLIGNINLMASPLAHHRIAAAAATCRARRLMAISLGDTRVIVTCNPDVAREILNSSVFADRPIKESAYSLMFNRAIGFAPYGVNRFVSRIIAEHRAENREKTQDFVDVLLSLQGADKLSDADMIAVLWEMTFRGTDTVAVTIEWILARMVLHPEVQSRVHDELDKVVGRSRAVEESDITAMVYLPAVIKEVLRLHPPGPLLSWARLAISDTIIDGYHVPAGTTAMVNMWAITRDPDVWTDPLEFMPDRFVIKAGEVEFSVLGSDLRLAPFGSGRRACPGKNLGLATFSFWVASLLHEFEWIPSDSNSVDLSEVLKLSCEMANPLRVKVRPRRGLNRSY
ncbi:hypothetical protein SLEP1_g2212 [Rubroshorea leprosula]|uniref:Cytochrome P450 n=1 Tax=Rubroshorea leprosula TaxID=152421 RepID=A0AAV5HMZ4_9ROSI|nr:hypothetical protein SLEP1_g2212 [Rubroshorea leprosula]